MKSIFGLLIVINVALWSVWPMVIRPDRVADYGMDGMYLAAIQMNWHQKITDYIRHTNDPKTGFFDGYFFYTEKNSLAYSDMLFVTSLLTYIPAKLSNIPSMGAGMALIMGQVLMMVISYGVFAKMSKSVWGGVIGSIAFGLSQLHFIYQVHLHTWIMVYWLLSFWLFTQKKYLLSGLFLGLQFWESPLGVYFGLALMAIWIFSHNVPSDPPLKLRGGRNCLLFSLVFGLIAFWPARAYWQVSQHYHYVRTIRDAAYHGLSLNNLDGFWSIGLFILFILAICKIKRITKPIKFFILLTITSYILALGPVFKWNNQTVKLGGVIPMPLPYAIAYYSVPGWQAFRVPSRWMVLVGWGMAGIVAMGLSNLKFEILNLKSNSNIKAKISKTFGFIGCIVIAILGGTHITKYIDLPRVVPKEYLVDQDVLTFKPMGGEPEEIERMYFSILTGKKTMNGFSGFLPPERVKWLNEK